MRRKLQHFSLHLRFHFSRFVFMNYLGESSMTDVHGSGGR
ncbi:hypothetical protein BVRB_1g008760 [Beta vulgaris subsp. vulgaris]|nr:hypothetical protein BVRB_1g008760 [Beta vulgaris subsp. vulgaris]